MKLLVSIHDVMPATLGRVENIFDRLAGAGLLPVTLLVVPGRGWRDEQLDRLRRLVARSWPATAGATRCGRSAGSSIDCTAC
jgi:hypothetical protein